MIFYYLPISDKIATSRAVWLTLTNVFSTCPAVLWKLILCTDHQGFFKILLKY